jgi:hypothetical protein
VVGAKVGARPLHRGLRKEREESEKKEREGRETMRKRRGMGKIVGPTTRWKLRGRKRAPIPRGLRMKFEGTCKIGVYLRAPVDIIF